MLRFLTRVLLIGCVLVSSDAASEPERAAPHRVASSAVIAAPPMDVWRAISTSEGLARWLAPAAHVELEIGGSYEVYLHPDAEPGERGMEGTKVLAFIPGRMLAVHGSGPPSFPEIRNKNVAWTVYELQAVEGDKTLVTLSGLFPRKGFEWEARFAEWVRAATEITLDRLETRFEGDPGS